MFRILNDKEKETLYPYLFKKIFGYYDDNQIPRIVIMHKTDYEPDGFISGYMFNKEIFYLSWGGTRKSYVSMKKFWDEGEQVFINSGVKQIITSIENINTKTQRLMMGLGYIPYGIKVANGKIFVDYYKELK